MSALPAGPPVDCQLSPFLATAIGLSLAVVAFPTLVPEGSGWAWGAPLTGLRWYLTVPSDSVTWSTGSRLATTTTGLSAPTLTSSTSGLHDLTRP